MCGFAGFVTFGTSGKSAAERAAILARMGRSIAHRGPDDEQFFDDGTLALVFRRLSIIDLDGGQQPIRNARGHLLTVFNGEIYNHRELRRQFGPDHRFATNSDCELPMHLFERDGLEGLSQLEGMFAGLIWDEQAQRLLLVRDRLGIKPLYIAQIPGGLLFGSELKALLAHPDCPREIDWQALVQPTFLMRTPVPTYVRGVEHLPGGHHLVCDAENVHSQAYWRIEDHIARAPFGADAKSYREAYDAGIEQAVVSHLLADVPVGLHLSGGIDSSLIAAIAAHHRADLACFTVVERTSFRAGDVESARRLTSSLGVPWYPVLFDFRTFLDEIQFDLTRFEQSVAMMDSPRFNPEWILKEELHRFSRREHLRLKVVLLGQGADEFAGGYSHRIDRPRSGWVQYLDEEARPALRRAAAMAAGMPDRFTALARATSSASTDPYHQFLPLLVQQLQCYNLWHEDRTSMAQSLEARVPFLDHRLVELLASVPASLHPDLFWNKSIVREALQRRVPQFDRNHPKVPFVSTNDQRSIQIMVYEMLRRIAPAFIDKYLEIDDLPFDVSVLRHDLMKTLARSGAFYDDSWRLLECMAVVVFWRQLHVDVAAEMARVQGRRSDLRALASADCAEVQTLFSSEPVLAGFPWRPDSRPRLPEGAEAWFASDSQGLQRCALMSDDRVTSEIVIPAGHVWAIKMLRNLGSERAAGFVVSDWAEEFDIPTTQVIRVLEVLYQAGFVVADERR